MKVSIQIPLVGMAGSLCPTPGKHRSSESIAVQCRERQAFILTKRYQAGYTSTAFTDRLQPTPAITTIVVRVYSRIYYSPTARSRLQAHALSYPFHCYHVLIFLIRHIKHLENAALTSNYFQSKVISSIQILIAFIPKIFILERDE